MTSAGAGSAAVERERTLRRLDHEVFDVLVVGGGATGAGVTRDAALRGLRVALVEAGDFAGETSSHSSKLIHGGLRYLQYGDFALVFQALAERRYLMATAPHLCRPIDFLFPAYRGLAPRLATLGAGIFLYNSLALWRSPVGGSRLSPRDVLSLSPFLRADGLQGAQLYVDCQTDDARLVLETVLDAASAGATVAPRVMVTELLRDRRQRVRAARARDRLGGAEMTIKARTVVNATGPFSDAFDRRRHNLRPTLGVHLVFDVHRMPHGEHATVLRSPRDGRLVFMLPAGARTIVGTTDTDWAPAGGGPPRPPRPGDLIAAGGADVDYLLEVANTSFPQLRLGRDDVVSTFAGLRPLIATPAHTASATSREHELLVESDGLLTIAGGKLTTYRLMAEQAVDLTIELLRDGGYEGSLAPCSTATRPLPGGRPGDASLGNVELAPEIARHLWRSYGARAPNVVACMTEARSATHRQSHHQSLFPSPDLSARIDPQLPYCWAEVVYAARYEMVSDLEDVLRRRVPLFRDARDQGVGVAPVAANLLGDELGWSSERRAQSVATYFDAVAVSRLWMNT